MSWLSNLFRRARHESFELEKAKEQERISAQRLKDVQSKDYRISRVANSLEDKKLKNGWGEVIAETMRRAR